MATSELDLSIDNVENQDDIPSTFETSDAIRQPVPRKRLQKKTRVIDDDDDNNFNNEVFETSERFDELSMSHEDSGKKSKKDKRHMLEELAQEQRIANAEEDEEIIEYAEEGDEKGDEGDKDSQRKEKAARKKGKSRRRSTKKDEMDFFLEEIKEKKNKEKKPKAEKPAKKNAHETLVELQADRELYTLEEEDEPKRGVSSDEDPERQVERHLYGQEREKAKRVTKSSASGRTQSIKSRNKLFGEITDFIDGIDETPVVFEEYAGENIEIAKPQKKKDINRLLTNIDQYKTEKIRVPIQRSNSGVTQNALAQSTQPQTSEPPVFEALPHSVSMPPASLPSVLSMPSQESESVPSTELQKMDSIRTMNASTSSRGATQKSLDFKSMINSKSSIPLEDDRLLEVEVAVPHMTKAGSQTLADNTLFINFLARQTSFIDKNTIKAQFNHGTKKNDLKSLTQRLAEQHKAKKSANLTLEMINTRFQTTDLKDLDKKAAAKKKTEGETDVIEEKENDEKDSDYNAEELEAIDGENEFTFQGPLEGDVLKNSDKKEEKKVLDVDDIRRLEEGEEDEEDDDYKENEEGEEGQEEGYVEDEAEEDFGRLVESDEDEKKKKKKNDEDEDEEEESKGEGKKKYKLDRFADLDVYFNEDEEEEDRERLEEGERKYRKLKRIKEKIIDSIKKKEKRRKDREERRQKALERQEIMAGYMDLEAELGSDKEENDDMIRNIDRKDEEENEDGLDEDLDELIDYAYQEIGENDEVAFNHFFKDLIHEDRENIKKVIQRSFNSKKRKRDDFDIDIEGDDRELKKMKRMQEIIQQLEESENVFLSFGDMNAVNKTQAPEVDDAFNDTNALKHSELIKARHQMKKILQKKSSFETQPRDLFITSDLEVMQVLQQNGGDKKKGTDLFKQGNENNKSGASMLRQKTITKNSILNTKDNPRAINFFNNPLNKDIMNEYGSREGLMAAIERQAGMKPNAQKTASVINNNTTTAEQKSKVDKKGGAPATSAAPTDKEKQ